MSPREARDLFNLAAGIFLEAVELPPERRESFLDTACANDPELRNRVASLLARHEEGPIFEEPEPDHEQPSAPHASAEDLSRMPGQFPPRYRLLEKIGEGGMSVVYRAEDTSLDRVVALKFLAPHLVNSPEAMERFEREAKAAAALDHPNICPVYDIDKSTGRPFIAMACLEGKTLAGQLQMGPLALLDAIDIAMQVCRGLSAAHGKHVVHRDIKPANLMITQATGSERLVRILDFGIARLTQKSDLTAAGLTMGTVSYIAPEQVQHSAVDGRADLWALGVVLYRMVAGELPFQGDTTQNVIAAITGAEPKPLSSWRPGIPGSLEAIVQRALRKDPDQRYQTADEFLEDLQQLRDQLRAGTASAVKQKVGGKEWYRRRLAWITAAACLAPIGLYLLAGRTNAPPKDVSLTPFTSFNGLEGDPAISPDGTRIAYTWNGESDSHEPDIYVQLIGTTSPLRLTNTPYGEFFPKWSPDGTHIAFLREANYRSSVVVVPALGGPEREIATAEPGTTYAAMDWSPAADILAVDASGSIITISLHDRAQTILTAPRAAGDRDSLPRFDPTGKSIAFIRYHADRPSELMVVPVAGGEPTVIDQSGSIEHAFSWNSDGSRLVYAGHRSADGAPLRAIGFPDASPVTLRTSIDHAASPDIRGRRLAYIQRIFNVNIWEAPVGSPNAEAKQRIASSRRDHSPQFSPDGRSIVFASTRSGAVQLWRCDRDGRNLLQLTFFKGRSAGTPRWSPDGRTIAFDATIDDTQPDIYVVDASGGIARRITTSPTEDILPNWSSDGRWIYFCSKRKGKSHIWKIPAGGGEEVQVTQREAWEAIEPPGGKYLFYSEPGGPKTIHRLDLTTSTDTAYPQLGNAGARRYWAPTQNGIYFVNSMDDPKWIQFLEFQSGTISKVRPIGEMIVYGPPGLAVSPDGNTLLWVQKDQDDQDIMLLENFE